MTIYRNDDEARVELTSALRSELEDTQTRLAAAEAALAVERARTAPPVVADVEPSTHFHERGPDGRNESAIGTAIVATLVLLLIAGAAVWLVLQRG